MVHKYAHLIHSITSPDIHALTYLGDQAVNLTHVVSATPFYGAAVFRPPYANPYEHTVWMKYWMRFRDCEPIVSTWVALIDRNPGLKSVRIHLKDCDSGTERIIHALAKREHLEEVYLEAMMEADIIEKVLDLSPHILSLSASCAQRSVHYRGVESQIFKTESMGGVSAPTKIRYLNL